MKNINIPEPCSENWNEMTPTEKGGFCQKCALDVYDFTNKSGDEIRDILRLNIGSRVCGRIQTKQLNGLNEDFSAWRIINKRSYQRAWVFTLFVVFGMTLFSCEEDEIPTVKKLQKTTQTILNHPPEPEMVKMSETSNPEHAPKIDRVQHVQEPIEQAVTEEFELLGEVVEVPEKPKEQEEVKEKLIFPEAEMLHFTMGAMISTTHFTESLVDSTNLTCEADKLSGLVYPNPASNQTTLKVNMPSKGEAEIELFNLNGQNIKTIHNGRVSKGESEYPIDVSGLETGVYLVVVISNGNKETIKFSKI